MATATEQLHQLTGRTIKTVTPIADTSWVMVYFTDGTSFSFTWDALKFDLDNPQPLGEDTTEVEDLDTCYEVIHDVQQELVDMAMSSNISRDHHLESAVDCFASIGTLFEAKQIIRENLDPRWPDDESSGLREDETPPVS